MTWMETGAEPVLPAPSWSLAHWDTHLVPHRGVTVVRVRFRNGVALTLEVDSLVFRASRMTPLRFAEETLRPAVNQIVGEWERQGREDRDW